MIAVLAKGVDRAGLARAADALAVATAVSLPWSTSATGILVVLWLAALAPTLDVAAVRKELSTAAGALPVLLWGLGALGMLWADVGWWERLEGFNSFHRLLVIPLLLAQFRRSDRAWAVMIGFLCSCLALLVLSWLLVVIPGLQWRGKVPGVPVKDAIVQSGFFAVCMVALVAIALDRWQKGQRRHVLLPALLAALFLTNMVFVATSRTALLVVILLLFLLALRRLDWTGIVVMILAGSVLAAAFWVSSPYLQRRINTVIEGLNESRLSQPQTSAGERIEFWKKSVGLVAGAPMIGHGTGSIKNLFQKLRAQDGSPLVIDNPHNQTLTIAIQLGLLGVAVLYAMWLAHLALFRRDGFADWFGLMIVIQNVIGSLFNSYLFDFTPGWLYVFGVGVAGGAVLRGMQSPPPRLDDSEVN